MSGAGPQAGGFLDASAMPVAHEARSEFEAQCIRSVLEDAGIRSVVLPGGQALFGFPLRAGGAGVPVRVLPEDLTRARQAISEARWVGRSIDWDELDVGDMPPEVARMMGRARQERIVRRVMKAIAWVALLAVAGGIAAELFRAVASG